MVADTSSPPPLPGLAAPNGAGPSQEELTCFCDPPLSDADVSAARVGDLPSGSSEHQVSAPVKVASGDIVANPVEDLPLGSNPTTEAIPAGSNHASGEVEVALVA
ncbi:hypothetical protein Salat_0669500 [Sesamum alatum]|uniref:Uncharacterized protein n=1 Tax=Sesamum alatum TaxID=300844 RepID=A0AAE2CUJ6_9LAMI|nr:hypothetical protein Salat_0669500 [Sesamum alatum]